MILNQIFAGILQLFNSLINLILTPLDLLLNSVIPNYQSISENVANLFDSLLSTFQFVIEWIHIPSGAVSIFLGYITFKLTLYFGSLSFKFLLKWYWTLKQ